MSGKGTVNKTILVGNLGADPETRHTPAGMAITSMRVATTHVRKDQQSNEQIEETEWHRVKTFGKLAEICGQYLSKGSKIYVEGRLKTDKWEDKEGVTRYTTEILCNEMTMLSAKQDGAAPRQQRPDFQAPDRRQAAQQQPEFNDPLPF